MEKRFKGSASFKNVMSRDKWIRIAAISLVVLIVALFFQYVSKQQFIIQPVEAVTLQEMVQKKQVDITENGLQLVVSDYEWTQLLAHYLDKRDLGDTQVKHILYEDGAIHMELETYEGKMYSFMSDVAIVKNNHQLELQLVAKKMGTFESRVAGFVVGKALGVPNAILVDMPLENELFSVTDVVLQQGNVVLKMDYNPQRLAERMQDYKKNIDSAKLALQLERNKITESLITTIKADEMGAEQQRELLNTVAQGEEAIVNTALIFNEEGTRQFLSDFKDIYAPRINIERIVERSRSELEQNIQVYHHQFSKSLLRYLFNHPTYTTVNNSLQVYNGALTAQSVLQEQNVKEQYATTIESDANYIYATYKVGEQSIKKVVLKKGGEEE